MEEIAKLLEEAESIRNTPEWTDEHQAEYDRLVAQFETMEKENNATPEVVDGNDTDNNVADGDSSDDNVDAAVAAVTNKIDETIVKLDEFAEQMGETNFVKAGIEVIAGKATEGASILVKHFGPQLLDLFILYLTWAPRVTKHLPNKVKIPLRVLMIFSLVGGSALEGVLRTLAKQGRVDQETVDWLDKYGIETLEGLSPRKIIIDSFTGGDMTDEEQFREKALGPVLTPLFDLTGSMVNKYNELKGSNSNQPVASGFSARGGGAGKRIVDAKYANKNKGGSIDKRTQFYNKLK